LAPAALRLAALLPEWSDLHQGHVRARPVGGGAPPRSRNAGRGDRNVARTNGGASRCDSGYATPKVDVSRGSLPRHRSCWCRSGATAAGRCRAAGATWRGARRGRGARGRGESGLPGTDREAPGGLRQAPTRAPAESLHAYKLFFRCDLVGGPQPRATRPPQWAFFAENALPPLSLARVTGGADSGDVRACEESFPSGRLTTDWSPASARCGPQLVPGGPHCVKSRSRPRAYLLSVARRCRRRRGRGRGRGRQDYTSPRPVRPRTNSRPPTRCAPGFRCASPGTRSGCAAYAADTSPADRRADRTHRFVPRARQPVAVIIDLSPRPSGNMKPRA